MDFHMNEGVSHFIFIRLKIWPTIMMKRLGTLLLLFIKDTQIQYCYCSLNSEDKLPSANSNTILKHHL